MEIPLTDIPDLSDLSFVVVAYILVDTIMSKLLDLRLVFWLLGDSLIILFQFASMQRSHGCLRCLQMMELAITLLGLVGLTRQGRIQTPGTGALLRSLTSQGAVIY